MQESKKEEGIELPAPTLWPMLAAFGMTLTFAGLVTHPFVSITGAVCFFVAGFGWWREVLPAQHEEVVPLRPVAERARPVVPSEARVETLGLGEQGHRMRLPTHVFPLSAGIRGGLAGGVAMAALAELFGVLVFDSLWYPVNLLAAAGLPSLATADTSTLVAFDGTALGVAIVIHLILSLLMGLLYAVLLPIFPRFPVVAGGIVAPLLWTGLVATALGVIDPQLAERIEWLWFAASQVAFGLVAGTVIARVERVETLQSAPLAVRAGLEAGGHGGRDE